MAAVRLCAMPRGATRAMVARHAHGVGIGRSLQFMTTENAQSSKAYTTFAAILMVCLLAFGVLHSLGVIH
jgi:hypothetical protein